MVWDKNLEVTHVLAEKERIQRWRVVSIDSQRVILRHPRGAAAVTQRTPACPMRSGPRTATRGRGAFGRRSKRVWEMGWMSVRNDVVVLQ